MSVHCRIVVGPTVEILNKMNHEDFRKYHAYIDNHPDMEDSYDRLHEPGAKMILFADGMNGQYLRLTYVQSIKENGRIDHGSDLIELAAAPIDETVIKQMQDIYKEYTGEDLQPEQIKNAMWTQWT